MFLRIISRFWSIVTLLTVFSCTKTDLTTIDGVSFSPSFAVPLAKVSFIFEDFIKSDTALKVGADKSIQVVYVQDNVATFGYADMTHQAATITQMTFQKTFNVGDMAMNTPILNSTKSLTLNDLVNNFSEPNKTFFVANFGRSTPIPAFSQNVNSVVNLDDMMDFTTATFAAGSLDLTIKNNYPFPLSPFSIQILDRSNNNAVVQTLPVPSIAAGANVTASVDLTGNTLSNQLAYRLLTIGSAGTGVTAVVLDGSKTLGVEIGSRNLKIKSGTLKIPQTMLSVERTHMDLMLPRTDQKLTEIEMKTATVNFVITMSRFVQSRVSLYFPTVKINGLPVTRTIDVTSSPTNGTINFANATIDLTADPSQPFNRIPVEITTTLIPSANLVTVSHTDNFNVHAVMLTPSVKSAKGQFGAFELNVPTKTVDFAHIELFKNLDKASQKLLFDDPKFTIRTANSFGIPIEANIGVNAAGVLSGIENLNPPTLLVAYPRLNQLGQTIMMSHILDKNNSNIVNFLSILPQKLTFAGKININSKNSAETHFFTEGSKLSLSAHLDLPLKFSTASLIVRDTTATNPLSNIGKSVENLESTTLIVQHKNGFPTQLSIEIYALTGQTAQIITNNIIIPAATVGNDGRVTAPNVNKLDIKLTKEQMAWAAAAQKLIVVGKLQTANGGTKPVTLLTNYGLELNVSAVGAFKF